MDVPSLMRQAMRFNADRTAIIAEGRSLTYAEAWDRGVRVANGLIEAGVKPGDRVAVVEDNTLGAADIFLGAAIAGAVRVPLYPRNSTRAHHAMTAGTDAVAVVAEAPYAAAVAGMEHDVESVHTVLIRDQSYEDWLAHQSGTDPRIEVAGDDWFIIRHSSGTTGTPKGVGYTQHEWLVNCRNWYLRLPNLTWDSIVAHAAPISHAAGYLFTPAWLAGATNLLCGRYSASSLLRTVVQHRVTHLYAAPTMLADCGAEHRADEHDFSYLRCVLVGGSPITSTTVAAGRRVFGDVLYQVFGQTEATPLAILTPQEWFTDIPGSDPMRSAGRVLPFCRLEIRGSDGQPLDTGAVGEIWTQVEAQMHGYWNNPQKSAEHLVDGWIRTGDVGRLDANGFLYVLDRIDDMIVSGGFNIWPAEVEAVIAEYPGIRDVAVFGVPHPRWGETPLAHCVVDAGAEVTPEQIRDHVKTALGSYQKPTIVELTSEPLPRSATGKVLRNVLRDPHWVGHDSLVGGA